MTEARKRILVVDDDDDIRRLASLSLERVGGYEVTTAPSGREALSVATGVQPDAIVLDVRMPELDGPATLRELRKQPDLSNVPVVFLTASVHRSDRAALEDSDVFGVLDKPFDPMELPGNLAALLGWS